MKLLKGGCIGDIHLGNTRNNTSNIIKNLYKYLTPKLFKDLDFFVINGDLFDRDIPMGSLDALLIAEFDKYLNDISKKYNVYLYYLKGTFTHDYNQIKTLTKYNDSPLFKYIEKIHINYNKELDIYIGFIPDDTGYDPLEIERILLDKMSKLNIDKLDFLFIHGMFDYQLPIKLEHSFDIEQFKFVKHYIIINHIHKPSVMNNIIAPGSFDRLTFGEEENKGFVTFMVSANGNKSFSFIVNKNAMLFSTIDINTDDVNYWYHYIESFVNKHNPSHIRLYLKEIIDTTAIIDMLKRKGVKVKIKKEKNDETEVFTTEDMLSIKQIDNSNIKEELTNIMGQMSSRHETILQEIF